MAGDRLIHQRLCVLKASLKATTIIPNKDGHAVAAPIQTLLRELTTDREPNTVRNLVRLPLNLKAKPKKDVDPPSELRRKATLRHKSPPSPSPNRKAPRSPKSAAENTQLLVSCDSLFQTNRLQKMTTRNQTTMKTWLITSTWRLARRRLS